MWNQTLPVPNQPSFFSFVFCYCPHFFKLYFKRGTVQRCDYPEEWLGVIAQCLNVFFISPLSSYKLPFLFSLSERLLFSFWQKGEMESTVQWRDLPEELLGMIAQCLNSRVDVLRFRSVCMSWRRVPLSLMQYISSFLSWTPLPLPFQSLLLLSYRSLLLHHLSICSLSSSTLSRDSKSFAVFFFF